MDQLRAVRTRTQPTSEQLWPGAPEGGLIREFARDFTRFAGPRIFPAGILLVAGALVESLGLLMLLPLLSVVFDVPTENAWIKWLTSSILAIAPDASRIGQIALVLGIFGMLMAIRAAIILTRDVLLTDIQVRFVESHRVAIINLLARARWDVLSRLRHGRITHVLGQDVQSCGIAAQLMLQNTVAAAMLTAQLVLIFLLSPTLAGILLAIGAVSVATLRRIHGQAQASGAEMTDTQLNLMNAVTQFVGGLKLAVSQDLQGRFVSEFESELRRAAAIRVLFSRQRTLTQLAVTGWAAAAAAIAILVGAGLLATPPATLLALLLIVARMTSPAIQIQTGLHHLFHSLPAYGKIRELEQELVAAGDEESHQEEDLVSAPAGPIEFDRVSFWHSADYDEELRGGVFDFNLRIEQGEFVGLAGPSGAGKTTVLDLLVGLYRPRSGEITVGPFPLEGRLLAPWRRTISYVSQDPFLFHDTIRNNLIWAAPTFSEVKIWEALAETDADQIVGRMDLGLETVVGERGTLVSGGERQRLAISRALLRRPSLLLLDEATSALDAESERRIIERIARRPARPTIIVVAHRQETLRLCDRVIELRPKPQRG